MKASTRYITAVQICIFLEHSPDELSTSSQLAESVSTNPVVIRRLIHDLITADIVSSISGPNGGFKLARQASEITLRSIYEATRSGSLFRWPGPNPDCVVSSNLGSLLEDRFAEAEEQLMKSLESTTIAALNKELEKVLGSNAGEQIRQGK